MLEADVEFPSVCCEYHCLIKKPTWLDKGRVELCGENQTECWEKEGRVRRSHVAPPETDARTLPGKPQPCGDT